MTVVHGDGTNTVNPTVPRFRSEANDRFAAALERRARINHPFLKKISFTGRTEFRREVTEPNLLSAR